MSIFGQIAESKIREAMDAGEFDDLPGAGKPLDLDSLRRVRPGDRAAYTLLRNSGFAPEEVGTRSELARIDAEIAAGDADAEELERLRKQRLALELKRNFAADKRLGRL